MDGPILSNNQNTMQAVSRSLAQLSLNTVFLRWNVSEYRPVWVEKEMGLSGKAKSIVWGGRFGSVYSEVR